MDPKISIVVPVYNIDQHLRKCLDSILAQTFTGFEVIVVNDGSTDNSGQICDEYVRKDRRIKLIHKKHGGVSSSRNVGVECAEGDYIGFVDGDDYIDKNMYQTLYQLCFETGSDISICNLGREINGELMNGSEEVFIKEMDNIEAMRQLFKGLLYRFSLCNKLFHRDCFNNIQFPVGRIHEDLSTTYKLFSKANKVAFTNYIGYLYVKRENSILTSKYYEKRLEAFIGWDEILSFIQQKYPQLSDEVNACFTYASVDHIYYILNQVEDNDERESYLNFIRTYVRKNYKQIRKNTILPFNYRLIATLITFNVKLYILVNGLMNYRKRFIVKEVKQ